MSTIEQKLTERFRHFDALARTMFPEYARMPVPRLLFFTKGRANGCAHAMHSKKHAWTVRLNSFVAAQTPDAFDNTVSHEIAHMVDYARRGRSGHDRIWKAIHRALGGTGARCSQYGSEIKRVAGRVTNWYLYRNASGAEILVGPKHHAALRSGKYTHLSNTKTRQRFTLSDWTGIVKQKG